MHQDGLGFPVIQGVFEAVTQQNDQPGTVTIPIHPWDREFKPGFRLQAEMAVQSALGKANGSVSLDVALDTMDLISKIYEC